MRQILAVDDSNFGQIVLGSATPVVVGVGTPGSPASDALLTALRQVADAVDWLTVIGLDVDRAPRTRAAHDIGTAPAVLVFDHGRVVLVIPGVPAAETLRSLLVTTLGPGPDLSA